MPNDRVGLVFKVSHVLADGMAVVDPELRVHGIARLRVIDSSIIPQIPSGNLNAISMAIGEKGADMVLAAT